MDYGELYSETGSSIAGVESATYTTKVDSVRPTAGSRLLWLTLEIQSGPNAGKQTDVNIYLPKEGDKPFARTMFLRKLSGFVLGKDVFDAMTRGEQADGVAGALQVLGLALINKVVDSDLLLRTEGDYAGSNELKSTKPAGVIGAVPAPPSVQTVAAPAAPAAVTATPAAVTVAVAADEPF